MVSAHANGFRLDPARNGSDDSHAGLPGVEPLLEPQPDGGQVVITRFECPNLPVLVYLLVLHRKVRRAVRDVADGFVTVQTFVDWRTRTLLSISVWKDLASVYSMGNVTLHIAATRVPCRLGVRTSSGVYCYVGDWRRVLFRHDRAPRSPLRPVGPDESLTT